MEIIKIFREALVLKKGGKMKAYTISSDDRLQDGIPVSDNVVLIGEEGRGRSLVSVPVIGPETDRICYAKVGMIEGKTVISPSEPDEDDRCLAVINTVGAYARNRKYDIFDINGKINFLVEGKISFGAAGRTNSGPVFLAIIHKGTSFRLNSKYSEYWYLWDGEEFTRYSRSEWEARNILETLKNGGEIEWL